MYHVYSFLLLVFVLMPTLSTSQTPFTIANQRSYSGDNIDAPVRILSSNESTKWLVGESNSSASIDHQSASNGQFDVWLIKEENNVLSWEISLGGAENEGVVDALVNENGDIILLCNSSSSISGNKTEENFGGIDFWLVKINSSGNIEWQKSFGGTEDDISTKLISTPNGYTLIGSSRSPVSGNKTAALIGNADVWIVNTDKEGVLLNQNSLGTAETDIPEDALLIGNQEVLIASLSNGDAEFDKTTPHFGSGDCWLFVYNLATESITKQVSLGGDDSEELACLSWIDEHIYVAVTSWSNGGGNKLSPAYGQQDIWLVNLNKDLDILSQATFGGQDQDSPVKLIYQPAISSNIFLLGVSQSLKGTGTKDVSNFGGRDGYLVEIEKESLNQISDTVFGGLSNDGAVDFVNNVNGFSILMLSNSGISGNKTVIDKGEIDFWLLDLEFEPNAIKEISVGTEFTVFPNPANTQIQLKGVNSGKRYYLYDAQNRVVKSGRYNQNQSIGLNELASGVYFLRVEDHQQVSKVLVH